MHPEINLPRAANEAFCRRWSIIRLELFGSVLRDDFHADSDIDFLVTFAPENRWSLLELVTMEQELSAALGRKVDLLERVSVERSHNPLRRREIQSSARPIYAA
ncbi:MAG: Nucleotidyltransferase domain protein [candidate division BRC1 bacterium ADurb.BinA292]|nr:MAG: Nucleotidyltransferase domain protein [candidate division BRC1 bacterium ADurb.BinA292]